MTTKSSNAKSSATKPAKGSSTKPAKGSTVDKPLLANDVHASLAATLPKIGTNTRAPKTRAPFGTKGAPAGTGAVQGSAPTTGVWATVVKAAPGNEAAKPGTIDHWYTVALKALGGTAPLHAVHAHLAASPAYNAQARATTPGNLQTRVLQALTIYGPKGRGLVPATK